MTEEQLAALDSDWDAYSPAERAAFAYARKLTYAPHRITDADVAAVRKHYTELQVLEMTLSVANNNNTTRWTDALAIPQEEVGGFFRGKQGEPPAVLKSFLTPSSPKYKGRASGV